MIAGTIIGGAVGGVSASNAKESKALAAAISEASVSSVSHESLSRATVSSLQAEWTQNSIALQSSSAAAVASVNELFKAPGTAPVDTALDPFTFKKRWMTETTIPTVTSAPSAALLDRRGDELPIPPVAPVSTVPADFVPPTYAGVPEYNIHMCKVDIVAMGTAGQSLVMNNPADRVLRVDNVPSTCMVLANFVMGNPTLAPFAIPMGAASLQWNDVDPAAIGKVREFFGVQ
ncbi:hypothetical protein LTR05_006579 [Lithohypha guttulata]|uniref:Uncharacterized protein n=1 Tax=Lithohypha guttulata TaxID=1690604 RepID=A0AAN7Y4W3_9EURO|nr:hypothetical protein LTR05_006579 [Lithohypha guttulata]